MKARILDVDNEGINIPIPEEVEPARSPIPTCLSLSMPMNLCSVVLGVTIGSES